jgi:hypothetical protein
MANCFHAAYDLVPRRNGRQWWGQFTGDKMQICAADTTRLHFQQNFSIGWLRQREIFDTKRFFLNSASTTKNSSSHTDSDATILQ